MKQIYVEHIAKDLQDMISGKKCRHQCIQVQLSINKNNVHMNAYPCTPMKEGQKEAHQTAPTGEPWAWSGAPLLLSALLTCWTLTTRMYSSITSTIKTTTKKCSEEC